MKKTSRNKKLSLMLSTLFLSLLLSSAVWISHYTLNPNLPTPENPPQFYATQCGNDLRITFSKALKEAKKSILVVTFALTDRDTIHLLNKKAEEGVSVSLLFDAKNNPSLKKKLSKKIHILSMRCRGLMHRKFLVIDKEKVWIGSANFTSESLRMHDNLVIGMHAPEMAQLIHQKVEGVSLTPPHAYKISDQLAELWFSPEDRQALAHLLSLIQGAQKSIKIAMFTWTHKSLAEAVVQAHLRGVKVEVTLDRKSSLGASQQVASYLLQQGIPVRVNCGMQLLHHKFAWIDEKTLACGSTNWTKAAFSSNADCFMVLSNLNSQQKEWMDHLWQIIQADSDPLPWELMKAA